MEIWEGRVGRRRRDMRRLLLSRWTTRHLRRRREEVGFGFIDEGCHGFDVNYFGERENLLGIIVS